MKIENRVISLKVTLTSQERFTMFNSILSWIQAQKQHVKIQLNLIIYDCQIYNTDLIELFKSNKIVELSVTGTKIQNLEIESISSNLRSLNIPNCY